MTDGRCSRKITGALVRIHAVVTVRMALNSLSQWKIAGSARKAMAGDEAEDSTARRAGGRFRAARKHARALAGFPPSGEGAESLSRRRHSRVKLDFRSLGCLSHPP